jgi:hypothetical protein
LYGDLLSGLWIRIRSCNAETALGWGTALVGTTRLAMSSLEYSDYTVILALTQKKSFWPKKIILIRHFTISIFFFYVIHNYLVFTTIIFLPLNKNSFTLLLFSPIFIRKMLTDTLVKKIQYSKNILDLYNKYL